MKKAHLITLVLFISIGSKMYSQIASPIVHDPKNNVQLMQLGIFLKKIQQDGKAIIKTLETAAVIRQYSKATDFVKTIENSYCILKDLDYYLNISTEISIENESCFKKFKYEINTRGIQNSIWQTMMAVTSTSLSLGERQKSMQDAFENLKKSNEELHKMKEEIKANYERSITTKKSFKTLAQWY